MTRKNFSYQGKKIKNLNREGSLLNGKRRGFGGQEVKTPMMPFMKDSWAANVARLVPTKQLTSHDFMSRKSAAFG